MHKEWLEVASKTVLDPHPTAAGIGIGNGVGVGLGATTCVGVITTRCLLLCFGDLYDSNKNGEV
jgi:hypothetical protein